MGNVTSRFSTNPACNASRFVLKHRVRKFKSRKSKKTCEHVSGFGTNDGLLVEDEPSREKVGNVPPVKRQPNNPLRRYPDGHDV
jgi:hypothetical protein